MLGLLTRDGEWVVGIQGGHQAEGKIGMVSWRATAREEKKLQTSLNFECRLKGNLSRPCQRQKWVGLSHSHLAKIEFFDGLH